MGVQPSGSGRQPPPPSYERILSGEFKELSLAEQRKIARGETFSIEFTVNHIPKELRPNRSRTGSSTVDSNPANPETSNLETSNAHPYLANPGNPNSETSNLEFSNAHSYHSNPENQNPYTNVHSYHIIPNSNAQQNPEFNTSIFMSFSSQPIDQINLAFTNDEYDEILSAMQSTEPSDINPSYTDLQRESNDEDYNTKDDSAVENNQAYRNSGYTDNKALDPNLDPYNEEPIQGDNKSINILSLANSFAATAGTNTRNATFKIVHSDLLNKT